MKSIAKMGLVGLALGFSLECIGFGDYRELHRMFTFADLRLFLTFAGAVALSLVGYALLRGASIPSARFHKGTVVGGALFGAGWVLTGACPAIALVQLGEGTLGALITLVAIPLGIRLYDVVNARWLGWETESCGS